MSWEVTSVMKNFSATTVAQEVLLNMGLNRTQAFETLIGDVDFNLVAIYVYV
jgi:hypothetical protein